MPLNGGDEEHTAESDGVPMTVGGSNEYQRLCGLRIVRVNEPRYFAVGL